MLLYFGGHIRHGPSDKRLKNVTERVSNLAALFTFVYVRRNETDAVGGEFAVEKRNYFLGSNGMRCGIHARSPFCTPAAAESFIGAAFRTCAEDAAPFEGSSNSRSAVRARKRRERTVLSGSCKR